MFQKKSDIRWPGFTLIELIIVVSCLAILLAIVLPGIKNFQMKKDLTNTAEEIIGTLRLAQTKAVNSEQVSKWGVYFDKTTSPQKYVLFKGNTYASRDVSFDRIYLLPSSIEITTISLAGGSQEVVFERINGATSQNGNLLLSLKADPSETATVYIANSGQVGLNSPSVPSATPNPRDSRRTHIDYSRIIDTNTETIALTFIYDSSQVVQSFAISNNLVNGQIDWSGEVNVGGSVQKVRIHTNRLNSPDTQFCIHRDRRYNNKALVITISGDASGSLIEYSADGLVTSKTSLYASEPQWQ
jgi:prepilin-type N-terminal cleavage/methylation domain-containing protein